ncbi:MAG: Lrp/AsnC family transcriptional regulator [Negativicutes bacterium]|nr:Lrp/AsnC family transcriptional regulator [Negativicutes bacterium]
MLDQTDLAILNLLRENSRYQWKEIGEKVHLTGQAVAARVQALQDTGVIETFTVSLNAAKLGRPILAFVTVFMNSADHAPFRRFVQQEERIAAAHRVSGEGCYWLQTRLASHEELNQLLEGILRFGNYRVSLSIDTLK